MRYEVEVTSKSTRRDLLAKTISMLWDLHGLKVEGRDIYIFGGVTHLCSEKTADLFRTSYHNFSNAYVPYLLSAGVRRITAGRYKYYNTNEILAILTNAHKEKISVFDFCGTRAKRLLKNKKRRK